MSSRTGARHTLVGWIGLAYVLAGAVLLLEQLGVITVGWSLLLPSLIIVFGLVMLAGAFRPLPRRDEDGPGSAGWDSAG
jgi:hypothetical protein